MIPYGRQQVTEADIAAVIEVLRSDYLTQGPAVPRFEQAVAARVGSLLSLWFSWTGLIVFVLVACAIYSSYLTQRELELYTRAP